MIPPNYPLAWKVGIQPWLAGVNFADVVNNSFLEVGGGPTISYGWGNLDPVHGEGAWKRKAQDVPWPCEDNSIDRIVASHVMEHVPAGADRITVMNEMHRVLKPEGALLIIVPLISNGDGAGVNWTAVADPTHVSFWMKASFDYFTRNISGTDYGIKYWKGLSYDTDRYPWEGRWVGVPVK